MKINKLIFPNFFNLVLISDIYIRYMYKIIKDVKKKPQKLTSLDPCL